MRDGRDRWGGVDWSRSVREIAAEMGCSTKRVYQVMKARGMHRPPKESAKERLSRMNTSLMTVPELATVVKCTASHVQQVLRELGKSHRRARTDEKTEKERHSFVSWLSECYGYPSKSARDMFCRCKRIEGSYDLILRTTLRRSGGRERVAALIAEYPRKLIAPDAKLSSLAAYRLALNRYAEFVRQD